MCMLDLAQKLAAIYKKWLLMFPNLTIMITCEIGIANIVIYTNAKSILYIFIFIYIHTHTLLKQDIYKLVNTFKGSHFLTVFKCGYKWK